MVSFHDVVSCLFQCGIFSPEECGEFYGLSIDTNFIDSARLITDLAVLCRTRLMHSTKIRRDLPVTCFVLPWPKY